MQSRRLPLALLAVAAALVAASCGAAQGGSPTLVPSRTPKPTFTPAAAVTPPPIFTSSSAQSSAATSLPAAAITATVAATAPAALPTASITSAVTITVPTVTSAPAPSPAPTAAPTTPPTAAAGVQFSSDNAVNVREGPSTDYNVLGQIQTGTNYTVLAKNQDGSWLEFNFNGDPGWVSASLVTTSGDLTSLSVPQNLPTPAAQAVVQPPQPAPAEPTEAPPAPTAVPAPPAPAPAPAASYDWILVSSGSAGPQCNGAYFNGQVQDVNGNPENGVCLELDFYGPRTVKFSGSGGAGNGNWGFSPCSYPQACTGEYDIYVVQCPTGGVPNNGQTISSGSQVPASANSQKFVANITNKCAAGQWYGIVFKAAH